MSIHMAIATGLQQQVTKTDSDDQLLLFGKGFVV
jgi:hypothetical protein